MKLSDDLRQSVLQAAMEGKLTKQLKEDGNADELLKVVSEEKEKLIKEKKIKKAKPLPEINEDEIPFDIPDNWRWVRFGFISSYAEKKEKINALALKDDTWVLDLEDVKKGGSLIQKRRKVESKAKGDKTIFKSGDLLYSKLRPYLKKVLISDENGVCTPEFVPFTMYGGISTRFVVNFLKSPYVDKTVNTESYGVKMPRVGTTTMCNLLFPLPPLAEQHRIVEKIDMLMAEIDELEKKENELEKLKKDFPEDMKASLLQAAMEGKLTKQMKEDGNADDLLESIKKEKEKLIKEKKIKKTKPLPEIGENEIPFDIPDNWRWVRLEEVIDVRDGTHDSPKYHSKGIPLITGKNLNNGHLDFTNVKYISEKDAAKINERSKVNVGDIIMAMIGTIGNPVIVEEDKNFCIKNVALFKFYSKYIYNKYIYLCLLYCQSIMKKEATGGVQQFVSLKFIRNFLVAIPPLAEQRRIVEKLDELLPLCEELKENEGHG